MNVRPTLSRLTGVTTEDPATTICIANAKAQADDPSDIPNIKSIIPQVDVRQLDSVLTLKSGEVMAIGGMIEQKNINNDSGVPYASEIPIFGNAFKSVDKRNNAVQTVIFLKATIVPSYGVDSFDQNLYNKFNTDPRPLKF
jgi:general secretion pathway protein D